MTPAPDVLSARLGPRMPSHRILLDVVTSCGLVLTPTWSKYRGPLSEIDCPVCKVAADVLREGRAEEPRRTEAVK